MLVLDGKRDRKKQDSKNESYKDAEISQESEIEHKIVNFQVRKVSFVIRLEALSPY